MSFANLVIITDSTVLEYEVGFPTRVEDLVVFYNGKKMILNTDYTFDQSKTSITLTAVSLNDQIQFRKIRSA